MDAKELIKRFKDWVKREKGRDLDLDPCEAAILEYSLEGKTYIEISDHIQGYEFAYIMNYKGPELFRRLREVTGKDVRKKNCRLVLTQLLDQKSEQIAIRTTNHLSCINLIDARDINDFDFYGREQELSDLQELIVTDSCRVVGVLGMSGIGKSALVRELVEKIQESFNYVIWKNLKYYHCLEEILTDIEHYFSCDNSETNLNTRITNLINNLKKHRCLLIFDQWEEVMKTGELSDNQQRSKYESFLQRIAESPHKSCLLFTSLQQPEVMRSLFNTRIQHFSLRGLNNQDAKTLLADFGLSNPGIERLIEAYQGHPLALMVASNTIKKYHNGQIYQFLEGTIFMPDVMLSLLDKLFSYLSNLEINIMQKLAAETEPKILSQIYQYFPSTFTSEILEAIDKLWQIWLIEKADIQEDRTFWVLNPLIKKYIKRRYKITDSKG
ncbi:NB-ARC domain-containing protein [Anabaena azotica]|uniref:NB-ARC domain-containing protein n=1 Tax=Anabaena azotica TaxID=197653 RepID=UPI0039A638F6